MSGHAWLEERIAGFQDLAAAVGLIELGLVDALRRPTTAEAVCEERNLDPETVRRLLNALAWSGLLSVDDRGHYLLTDRGEQIVGEGVDSARHALGQFAFTAPSWLTLARALRQRQPVRPQDWPAWAGWHPSGDEPHAERSSEAGQRIAAALPETANTLIDMGCGSGEVARGLLEARPALRITLVDRPPAVQAAEQRLAQAGLGGRVQAVGADLLRDGLEALPHDAHAVLISNVLHSYGADTCLELLERARSRLRPGGVVLIKDLHADTTGTQPREGVDFALRMALFAPQGDAHDPGRVIGWLAGAGFTDAVRVADFPAESGCFLVRAEKPA